MVCHMTLAITRTINLLSVQYLQASSLVEIIFQGNCYQGNCYQGNCYQGNFTKLKGGYCRSSTKTAVWLTELSCAIVTKSLKEAVADPTWVRSTTATRLRQRSSGSSCWLTELLERLAVGRLHQRRIYQRYVSRDVVSVIHIFRAKRFSFIPPSQATQCLAFITSMYVYYR